MCYDSKAHVEGEPVYKMLFLEYISWLDKFLIDPRIHAVFKDVVAGPLDPRQVQKPAGSFTQTDFDGNTLRNQVDIGDGKKVDICFEFNSNRGCNGQCGRLHICRGPFCRSAKHKFDSLLCRTGRPDYDQVLSYTEEPSLQYRAMVVRRPY